MNEKVGSFVSCWMKTLCFALCWQIPTVATIPLRPATSCWVTWFSTTLRSVTWHGMTGNGMALQTGQQHDTAWYTGYMTQYSGQWYDTAWHTGWWQDTELDSASHKTQYDTLGLKHNTAYNSVQQHYRYVSAHDTALTHESVLKLCVCGTVLKLCVVLYIGAVCVCVVLCWNCGCVGVGVVLYVGVVCVVLCVGAVCV